MDPGQFWLETNVRLKIQEKTKVGLSWWQWRWWYDENYDDDDDDDDDDDKNITLGGNERDSGEWEGRGDFQNNDNSSFYFIVTDIVKIVVITAVIAIVINGH